MRQAEFPRIGELFVGRYHIEDIIGSGGFSQVYRAHQSDLGREVAIKVLKPVNDPTKSESERETKFKLVSKRFEREARLISRLKDRNTVVMYDYGATDGGLLYMVLEYVDGITIAEMLQSSGPLAPRRVVKILRQALTSLHEAHMLGVLHRDIKPGNIMVYDHVGRADQVKVLDFGIAKTVDRADGTSPTTATDVTADGVLVGTPRYMSPEQIRGKTLTPASDVYSLGLVTYEMLMGMKAVDADSSLRIIARHLDTDPIALPTSMDVPVRLRSIINKMLIKDPADRYASCDEVLRDLERWDEEVNVPAPTDPTVTTDTSLQRDAVLEAAQSSSSSRWLSAAIVVLLIVIASLSTPWLLQQLQPDEDATAAQAPLTTEEDPVATVATVEAPAEPESETPEQDPAAATNAAANTIDAARTAAQETEVAGENDGDGNAGSDSTPDADATEPAEKEVVKAQVEKESKPRRRRSERRRAKKNRQKPQKPSKVDSESDDDLGLFGIE